MAQTVGTGSGGSSKKPYPNSVFYKPSNQAPSKNYAGPASTSSQPVAAPAPVPSYSDPGGYGGGGYGGGGGAAPAVAPPAPPPMTDVDWFNKDTVFKNAATVASNDLVDQLAQLLFQRNQGFQAIDNQRRDWGQARGRDSEMLGEDFASRGLNASGLYKQGNDELMAEYERRAGDINQNESGLVQQFGQRDSLKGGIDRSKLFGSNYDALAAIYGLLGQQGVSLGNAYTGRIQGLRGESAGRANQDLVKTLNW